MSVYCGTSLLAALMFQEVQKFYLMNLISPKIVERDIRVIPVQERVAVALQFLATGYSYTSLQYL
jgi:hypothetical protein